MKDFFCALAMAVVFWIPATAALFAIAAAIPLRSANVAITGAVGLLVALLLRWIVRRVAKDNDTSQIQP